MFKFESLERILADLNSKRTLLNDSKDFINIVRNIVGIVGEDYVYGLIRQKEFEWSRKYEYAYAFLTSISLFFRISLFYFLTFQILNKFW